MAAEDSSVPLTSNKREVLTCNSCLEIFRDPRLLPCSHTFCKKCLEDLTQQYPDGSFPCPTCGKRIKVSSEGSSGFQSSLYFSQEELERARNFPACSVHFQKPLTMFCLDCDLLLCVDCELTAHRYHRFQTLQDARKDAEKQLSGDKARIRQIQDNIQKILPKQKTNMDDFKNRKAAIKYIYQGRHTTQVDKAKTYLKEALKSLEDTCTTTENSLFEGLQIILSNLKKLDVLEQKMDRALQDGDSCTIINAATDVRTGCGSIENLERMEVLPLQGISWLVHGSTIPEDDAMFLTMKNFIRQKQEMTYVYTQAKVKVTEEVCCGEDDDSVVFCVCPGDSNVLISFESLNKALFDKHLSYQGKWISKTLKTRSSSYGYRGAHSCLHALLENTSEQSTYAKYGKKDGNYNLRTKPRFQEGFVCLDKVVCENPCRIDTNKLFTIDCGLHRAMDTNSAADLFAVVEEPRTPSRYRSRTVKLFRRDQSAAIATYQSPMPFCQPADVCFFMLGGQEVLLIADELNHVIHVVEVKDGRMTFSRFLFRGSPLLEKPTALNIDPKGRLWVGCRGGRLLTVTHTMPENDDDDGGGDGGGSGNSGGGGDDGDVNEG